MFRPVGAREHFRLRSGPVPDIRAHESERINGGVMKLLVVMLPLVLGVPCFAGTFEISNIGPTVRYAHVDGAWKHGTLCLQVTLKTSENFPDKLPYVKAYFYDKDRQLLKEEGGPTSVVTRGTETFTHPPSYDAGKKYVVYFAPSQQITRSNRKWKYVVFVFGDKTKAAAEVYPIEDVLKFEFKEKALMEANRTPRTPPTKR
jgi:hypothetical protein